MRRTLSTVLLLLCLGWAGTAPAAPAEVDPGADFQQHADLALRLYLGEHYEEAIAQLQAAYAIRPDPRLLLNLGHASRRIGRPAEALGYYMQYRDSMASMVPPATDEELAAAEQYIALTQAQLERDRKAAQPAPQQPAPPSPVKPPYPRPPTVVLAPLQVQKPPHVQRQPPLYRRGWFWGALLGSVAAGAVLAGVLSTHPWEQGLPANIPLHDAHF